MIVSAVKFLRGVGSLLLPKRTNVGAIAATYKNRFISFNVLLSLLLSGCWVNEGVTPLMFAAKEGNEKQVVQLLDEGVNVNKKSQYGWTALMFAAYYGRLEIAEQLIQRGADLNVVSKRIPTGPMATRGGHTETTALREAIVQSHLDVAHLLLDSGSKANYKSLDVAGAGGDISLVKKILSQGLSVNVDDIPQKNVMGSPLASASLAGDVSMMRYLLDQGADVDLRTENAITPLYSAIKSFNPKAVKLLLEEGADPNLQRTRTGIGNFSPLYEAISRVDPLIKTQSQLKKMYRILTLLLEYGAGGNRQSEEYRNYIATAEKAIGRNSEWSQEPGKSKKLVEGYKAKVVYWRKVLALLKKEQTSPSRQAPVAAYKRKSPLVMAYARRMITTVAAT